ncbi:MAG: OmpA family protein [Paramuribaculum sp.]|nr:OmpA family protein [Paramuribaculum sp.]
MTAKLLILIASLLLAGLPSAAQAYVDPYKDYSEETFMDMDFLPNINTPAVGAKEKETVRKTVLAAANSLKSKFIVDLVRDDEVFIASISTDELFLPNDTLMTEKADDILEPLLAPMRDPMAYKIVIAVHTDDTGSETYRENLSTARLNSVYDWFMNRIDEGTLSEQLLIIPFAMGGSMPLAPNNSRENRKGNRRLEVYFIPGPSIISAAQKAK